MLARIRWTLLSWNIQKMLFRSVSERTIKTHVRIAQLRFMAWVERGDSVLRAEFGIDWSAQCRSSVSVISIMNETRPHCDAPRTITLGDSIVKWRLTIAFPILLIQKHLLLITMKEHLKLSPVPQLGTLRDIILGPNHRWNCWEQVHQLTFLCDTRRGPSIRPQ